MENGMYSIGSYLNGDGEYFWIEIEFMKTKGMKMNKRLSKREKIGF